MVERQARDLEVRGSNPGSSNFALEIKIRIKTLHINIFFVCR